jgi:hypothetical protein
MMTRKPSGNDPLPQIWSKRNKVLRRGVCKLLMAVKGSAITNIPSYKLKVLEVRLSNYRRHGYKTATIYLFDLCSTECTIVFSLSTIPFQSG